MRKGYRVADAVIEASACIFVIRGCMFLLSLTATCQVCTVSGERRMGQRSRRTGKPCTPGGGWMAKAPRR